MPPGPIGPRASRASWPGARRGSICPRQVVLTKWDSPADPPGDPREQEVVAAAAQEARVRGLPGELATAFFTDQIEASKLVRFALMARWRRGGGAPVEPRADLRNELRPALDRLRFRFIDELVATRSLRERPDCRERLSIVRAPTQERTHLSRIRRARRFHPSHPHEPTRRQRNLL